MIRGEPMSTIPASAVPTTNRHLIRWVEKTAELCQPARIHWLDGSAEENAQLCQELVEAGTFHPLDPARWPGCFYARSSPNDVARVEDRTFICSPVARRSRPDQQLGRPIRHAAQAEDAVQGLHARPHHVRDAVQHGPGRLTDEPDRRAADRLRLCRGQHAHHGPHRSAGLR